MDKFNLKQFINENNLGAYSKLKEDEVEEGVADFNYAAAKAKLAGKSEFDFEGKNYKVTMSQAAAEKIVGKADANEEKTLPAAIAKAEKDQIEKDAMKSKGMVKEATDAEVIEILSDMLLKLSDGNTTARYAAFEVAKEQGVSFNLVLQKYQAKGGSLQDIDFETLKEGDLDVGHQDDEPGMLKNKLYRAAKMASMLYKKVDKYDKMGGEVDFPSWWQNKINKSQDMLQSAYDYLDGEENVAKLDAMAEKKVEVDDETEFKLNLRHLLDKHAQ